ncbi:dipeptidase 1-like [Artemia franciscana]
MKILCLMFNIITISIGNPTNLDYVKAVRVLDTHPLIDGHNDFPYNLLRLRRNKLEGFDFYDLTSVEPWASDESSFTDLKRLRAGKVGAQFWVVYLDCSHQYADAVQWAYEQIDVIKRLATKFSADLEFVTTTQGIEDAFQRGKIASLVGVEGGHLIGSSLGVLRTMYELGARYLTLTHNCNTPWADQSGKDRPGNEPEFNGLTLFGMDIVREMNRLGMLIDLSHVSSTTMHDALTVSRSPVIFSHSGARSVCDHPRNVPDDVLFRLAQNKGIVMVVFYPGFSACASTATMEDVIAHIEYIRNLIGVDFIGIGGDYDGVSSAPVGLEDVSKYPSLFAELSFRGWTEEELVKLAGGNFLRVMREAEKVKLDMESEGVQPYEDMIDEDEVLSRSNCSVPRPLF